MHAIAVALLVLCVCWGTNAHNTFPSNVTKDLDKLTYGEAAGILLPFTYEALKEGLKKWSDKLEPGDSEVHELRNDAGFVRDTLDIFYAAYPKVADPKNKSSEVLFEMLLDLDLMWTFLGHYRDLNSKPYNKKDRDKVMGDCVKAIDHYEKDKDNFNFKSYLDNPSKTKLHVRPAAQLSYLFWGWINCSVVECVPQVNDTALQNLALLIEGQWQVQLQNYNTIINLTDIFNETVHHYFHDVRKVGRSAVEVFLNFPAVYSSDQKKNMNTITEFHHNLGKVNSDIISYDWYAGHGYSKEAAQIKAAGLKLWNATQIWSAQNDIPSVFAQLMSALIPH